MRYKDIPQRIHHGHYEINVALDLLPGSLDDLVKTQGLQLEPDFQRAHVWTREQQIAYIEYFLSGGVTGMTIYLNKPDWHINVPDGGYNDFVLVDGLQRVTAIRLFVENKLPVFGQHFRDFGRVQEMRNRHQFKINVNDLRTKAEVLQWYIQMNAGGTQHTPAEIEKVWLMLQAEKQ